MTMYRLLSRFAMLTIALIAMVSCGNEIDPQNPPKLELERASIQIGGGGGKCSISYAVENGIKGELPTYKCDVDWIENVEIYSNLINFTVAASDSPDTRYGRLTISYKGAVSSRSIIIEQDKMVLNMFTISIDDITYNSCKVTYTPVDNEMLYIANIIDKEYFTHSGISTEEAFVAAEMDNYISVASSYGRTLEELIPAANLGGKGTITRTFGSMQPGGTYVVYCYGIEVSGNEYTVTVPIHYDLVTLPMPSMYEVDFTANISLSSNFLATISISPNDWEGYYYIQIAPDTSTFYVEEGEAPGDHIVKGMSTSFYKQGRSYMSQGHSAEQFLRAMCYKGQHEVSVQLDSGQRYMLILFAVESEDGAVPVMRSMPEFFYFTTTR